MWCDIAKRRVVNHFGFLLYYGFKIEFLSFEATNGLGSSDEIMVALIHNDKDYFAIRNNSKFSMESMSFYRLNSRDELKEIYKDICSSSSYKILGFFTGGLYLLRKIKRYNKFMPANLMYELDLFRKFEKKQKLLPENLMYEFVADLIKNQIDMYGAFFGIPVNMPSSL